MSRRSVRAFSVLVLSLTLLMTMMGAAAAVEPSQLSVSPDRLSVDSQFDNAAKSRSGQLAQTDPELLGRTDATPMFVMIKLDYDPAASYTGTVTGLSATSPGLTGRPLRASDPAVGSYVAHITRQENVIVNAIEAAVPEARILRSFRIAFGGVSAVVPVNRVDALLKVPGVAAVQVDERRQITTDVTPDFIGASSVWPSLGGSTTAGEGVIVGVLDTGIWPEHPSFTNPDITYTGPELECDFGDGSDPDLGDAFECNDKLIGAYTFVDTYLTAEDPLEGEFCNDAATVCTARDANGHGTHTSSTAAGSRVEEAEVFGVDHGPLSGIAPGAHVVMYRVCLDQGCFQSDSVAAVEQAISDGVDVLNFSIGGGEDAFSDPVELAFLDAYAAGIMVNASAGNEGPGPSTVGHTGPWTNTVGASTSPRAFETELELSAAGGSLNLVGATITNGVANLTDVVFAEDVPGYTDPLCQTPLPDDSAVGQVVACERGVVARVDKGKNVVPSGAVGMILYNFDPANGAGTVTDNHWLPTVHIDVAEGEAFVDFMDANADTQARWDPATATPITPDVMADFSSRGPLGSFLKPDVTAPGVQILAGATPVPVGEGAGATGQLFQAIAGTSMASPHAAGAAALIAASHPSWTPGQIKSALMTSSVQSVLKEDGSTPAGPLDRGAGSIRVNRAVSPTVTFDVSADDYAASAADPINRVHLNLPSIYADPMAGGLVTQRTLTNVSGSSRQVTVSASGASGTISVTPSSFVLPAGASQTLRITINGTSLADGWYFGQVKVDVTGTSTDAVLPVAFNKGPAIVTLSHSCSPGSVSVGTSADCAVSATNLAPVPAQVAISASTAANAATQLDITNVGAPGVESGNGLTWGGTLSASLAPDIVSVEDGLTPAGYLPLSLFGGGLSGTMTDEEIVNINVPAFQFGSEVYGQIGMTSNGYAVVGGGDAADVQFVPQSLPDTAPPNNVLAPYWTDLDPSKGGTWRVNILTDGVTEWLILEWEAFSTWDAEFVNTFQIWIEIGANEDITYAYGPIGGPDAIGLTVGAENRDGTSGAEYAGTVATGSELVVTATEPTPGGTVTIPYDALGKGAGTYQIGATMTTDQSSSSTTKSASVTVTGIPGLPFNDIAGSRFLDDILWLNDQGITAGCSTNPPLFCPDGLVTRGQMATFLSRALGLPASPVDYFTDDNGSVHEPNINRIRHAGITVGCGPNVYCPNGLVTRAQMATFMSRGYSLPASATDWFTDDNGSVHEPNINRMAEAGITGGCAPGRFCPTGIVTRGQMAAFLHRAETP